VQLWSKLCNGEDRLDHPINCVDWSQAQAYCQWVGGRLPTEAEWEYAARGNDGRKYPWGNDPPSAERLNACGAECVAMAKRELGLDWGPLYPEADGWESTAPVGSFPRGASPFGVLDMAGNVGEWTTDWYGQYAKDDVTDPVGPRTGSARTDRGGGWYSRREHSIRTSLRYWAGPVIRSSNVGFRCARGRNSP